MSDGHVLGANGGEGASELVDVLVMTYDRSTGALKIDGKVVNNDVAVEICGRAMRHFETLVRVQAAIDARQQLASSERLAGVARDVMTRRH